MKSLTLYEVEDSLIAFAESAESGIDPAQEQEFRADLARALEAAVAKRDRVGEFIKHLEAQAEFAAAEAKRLLERKQRFERAAERMRDYVGWTIQNVLGQDEQGRWRRLEGRTTTFSLRKLPDVLRVNDEASIPLEFKTLLIEVPAAAWKQHLTACAARDMLLNAVIRVEVKLDRRELLARLKEGAEVPGADIRPGDFGLAMR
jgi:hypothetical protein